MNHGLLTNSTLLVAAVFYGVLLALAAAATIFGIWLAFILLLSLWRYAYEVLRMAARGKRVIPAPDAESLNPVGDWRLVAHFIAFPALVVMLVTVQPFGAEGFGVLLNWAAALGAACVFPASAAIIGLTWRLEPAFNPAEIARMIRVLGRGYFVLTAVCLGVVIAAVIVPAYVLPPWGFFPRVAGNTLAAWALLATFALTGTLLREHRCEFQIPGDKETEDERSARLMRLEWRKTLDLAYASIRSGLLAQGYETLRRLSAEHGDSTEIQFWLFENMIDWEDPRHALQVAERLLDRQVADGDLEAALELFKRCRRFGERFRVTPGAARPLETFARSIGRDGLADELAAVKGPVSPPGTGA